MGKAYGPYQYYKDIEAELRSKAKRNNDKLSRDDFWKLNYYHYPYLILETDEKIIERFADLVSNIVDISPECKIVQTPGIKNDARFFQFFSEIIQETNWRGILTPDSARGATSPVAPRGRRHQRSPACLGQRMQRR